MYYGKLQEAVPGEITPAGMLAELIRRQEQGLASRYKEQKFPFDTPMWDGGVGEIKLASIVYNDENAETPSQEAWWPYEQSAYLLDGLVRLGFLLKDPEKLELFRKNLDYLVSHPDPGGHLGGVYGASASEWPMAVFFRAAKFYIDACGDERAKAAFIKHYQSLSVETLALGFRHINNLEGVLQAYVWSGDRALLDKAVAAYRLHDGYYSLHVEDEFELYRSKLASDHGYVIHGVSFSESVKLPVLLYLYTGDESYLRDAEKGLALVLERHEQIPGLPSSNEDFAGRDPLQGYETCVIADFSWALGYFLMASGDGAYADRLEKIFYNAFPGSLLKDFTGLQYLSSPNQTIAGPGSNHSFFFRGCATFRQFRSDHSAQCCTGNVHRILPNFVLRMWMKDASGAPAAVLYGASEYRGKFAEKEFVITENTGYPYSDTINFRFRMSEAVDMPFTFRIPRWCDAPELRLNGKPVALPQPVKGFAVLRRQWQDGDELVLHLPMTPVRKSDRHWGHYEYGTLVFSYAIPHRLVREYPGSIAPCEITPQGAWNFGIAPDAPVTVIKKTDSGFPLDDPPVRLHVPACQVSNWDELEYGRYTPEVPLFSRVLGGETELELVPYASTLLRITAFPDLVSRKVLNCHQVLVSEIYPYDFRKKLSVQNFLPEYLTDAEIQRSFQVLQPERSGYCDLRRHFKSPADGTAYLAFRVYSDVERHAVVTVSAGACAEIFFHGEKLGEIVPFSDGEFIAPQWFECDFESGYNLILVKVAAGPMPAQYRRMWGAALQAFYTGENMENGK